MSVRTVINEQLTGRRRHRPLRRWWGRPSLMILQVEVNRTVEDVGSGYVDTETHTTWRDARVTDLT